MPTSRLLAIWRMCCSTKARIRNSQRWNTTHRTTNSRPGLRSPILSTYRFPRAWKRPRSKPIPPGRLWIASDAKTTIEVRYSDGLHTTWSGPITIASGIKSDDISTIIAMPNDTIGVFWSNQSTKRFGFKVHQDGADATAGRPTRFPEANRRSTSATAWPTTTCTLAVASDGTLYVAVKTSYDKGEYPKMGLLVRRPNGVWDNFYGIADAGTRPVIVLDEADNQLIIAHTTKEGGGDIVYNTSPLDVISFSPTQLLIKGKVNNVTTSKFVSGNHARVPCGWKERDVYFRCGTTGGDSALYLGSDSIEHVDLSIDDDNDGKRSGI